MTFAGQPLETIGTIDRVLSKDIVHRVANDGDRTYLHILQPCKSQLPVTSPSQIIAVPLSNPGVDVVRFDKSFIRMTVTFSLNHNGFEAAATTGTTPSDLEELTDMIYYFIGFKNSSDFIGDYSIYHKGIQVANTLNSNGTVESFLYHTLRSEEDIIYRQGVHSEPQAALNFDDGICGQRVTLKDIQTAVGNNEVLEVTMDLIIPFNDIQKFQTFQEYPSALFGDLELRFKVNPGALVSVLCDPNESIKVQTGSDTSATVKNMYITTAGNDLELTREFTQLGDEFKGITHAKVSNHVPVYTADDLSFSFGSLRIHNIESVIIGYRANPDALERMRAKFETQPWVKFSQSITYLPFGQTPTENGLNCVLQTELNNTTDMIVLFPTTENESGGTVSKNPMLTNLSLTVMNRQYPEMPVSTNSPEFTQLMLNSASTLYGRPQRSFASSLTNGRWDAESAYAPYDDQTSFICSFKCERPSAMGLIQDGLNSNGAQVAVRLRAVPEFGPNCQYDEYCCSDSQIPAPVLVLVNDSYFIFNSKNGGQCMYSSEPLESKVPAFMSQ